MEKKNKYIENVALKKATKIIFTFFIYNVYDCRIPTTVTLSSVTSNRLLYSLSVE